jgi:hypothetical protein
MNSLKTVRSSGIIFLSFVLIGTLAASHSDAAVIMKLLINPASTAGGGATSTRSGTGSFQLYAVDDNVGTFGISSYQVTWGPIVMATNNRMPVTTIQDSNGDAQSAGFNLLRSASSVNPMTGSQNLPGQTPFLIKGFGQTTGDFNSVAAAAPQPASVVGPTTSGRWGGPYNNGLTDWNSGNGTKKWVLLGEGQWSNIPPFILTPSSFVTSATFTVYRSDFSSILSPGVFIEPEPSTAILGSLAMLFGAFWSGHRRP